MPFISLAEFKNIVNDNAEQVYFQSQAVFDAIEAQAAEIIKEKTGLAVPATLEAAPLWSKIPAAWLINYISLTKNPGIRAEDLEHGERLYDKAMSMLAEHRVSSLPVGVVKTAEIEGMESW